jgi:hypothetical protein
MNLLNPLTSIRYPSRFSYAIPKLPNQLNKKGPTPEHSEVEPFGYIAFNLASKLLGKYLFVNTFYWMPPA